MPALTLMYRPKKLNDIVGQQHVTAVVKAMVLKDDLPPVLIFAGASGTGKTSTARVLAAALNCENQQNGDPCGECADCLSVWKTQSNSVIEIDAASSGTVDAVYKIKELTYYAHQSNWRVIILDEAHSMSEDAFNVLLKALEEPPEHTVFVMITTEVFKIPTTIRTRAMQFEFRRIAHSAILTKLQSVNSDQEFNMENDLLDDIAKHAKGSLRDAIMQLDQASRINVSTIKEFHEVFGISDNAVEIIRQAMNGNIQQTLDLVNDSISRNGDAYSLISDLTEIIRDIIVVKANGVPQCLPSQIGERKELSYYCDEFKLVSAIKVLWQSCERIKTESDQLIAGQIVCMLLLDALKPIKPEILVDSSSQPITSVEDYSEEPLTFTEMMEVIESQAK